MKKIIAVIGMLLLVSLPLADAASFGSVSPYFSFTYGDGGGIPADVNNVAGQQISYNGRALKLFGDLGPIDGARFRSGFVFYWHGGFQGPINPGDEFVADLSFGATATGGSLAWNFYANLWSNEGFEQARILTSLAPVPLSGQVHGVHLESSFFTQQGMTGQFDGYLHLEWTGFSPTDTFSISIPQNSIDVTYIPLSFSPQLTITLSGADVVMTWPTNYSGFTLQSTTNLISPSWTTNSVSPVVVNGQNTITNPVSATRQFYRLSQ
jgi:hypothetical protein